MFDRANGKAVQSKLTRTERERELDYPISSSKSFIGTIAIYGFGGGLCLARRLGFAFGLKNL